MLPSYVGCNVVFSGELDVDPTKLSIENGEIGASGKDSVKGELLVFALTVNDAG